MKEPGSSRTAACTHCGGDWRGASRHLIPGSRSHCKWNRDQEEKQDQRFGISKVVLKEAHGEETCKYADGRNGGEPQRRIIAMLHEFPEGAEQFQEKPEERGKTNQSA